MLTLSAVPETGLCELMSPERVSIKRAATQGDKEVGHLGDKSHDLRTGSGSKLGQPDSVCVCVLLGRSGRQMISSRGCDHVCPRPRTAYGMGKSGWEQGQIFDPEASGPLVRQDRECPS